MTFVSQHSHTSHAENHTMPGSSEWDEDVAYSFYPEPEPDRTHGHSNVVHPTGGADVPALPRTIGARPPARRASGRVEIESLIYSLSTSGSSALPSPANSLPAAERERPVREPERRLAGRIAVAVVVAILLLLTALLLWPRGPAEVPAARRPTPTSPPQGPPPAGPTAAPRSSDAPSLGIDAGRSHAGTRPPRARLRFGSVPLRATVGRQVRAFAVRIG